MQKLLVLITVLTTLSVASIIDLDAQRKVLSAKQDLEKISRSSVLSPKLKKRLDKLRDEAIELSEIVYSRRCNSVSIHTIPDKTCNNFVIKTEKFIDSYAKWNKSFFTSRLYLIQQEKDFKKKVHTCIEMMSAFLNPTMTPEELFPYEFKVDFKRRYETEVTISFTPKYRKGKWRFNGNTSGFNKNGEYKYLKEYFIPWTNQCDKIASRRDAIGIVDQRFLEAVKEYWRHSPYTFRHEDRGPYTGIYIGYKKPRAYVLEILVNGKVYKEATVEYASESKKQVAMYLDVLPKEEIRLELGAPASHYISEWTVFIDGETDHNTEGIVSETFTVPEGNVEVRLKN